VFTRLGSRHVPWPEIAAARFLVGAAIAVAVATVGAFCYALATMLVLAIPWWTWLDTRSGLYLLGAGLGGGGRRSP